MSNIIITGANGFTGSHILENFNKNKQSQYKTIAACRNKEKLPHWYQDEIITGDLLDNTYINELTKKADVICHTAAWAEMNGGIKKSNQFFLEPTLNLIDRALKNNVKRFIFLSAITSNPIEQGKIHSNRSIEHIWPHYANILKIEKYLEEISTKGMEVIILRVGYFTGKNYSLGLLPILLPRLKTHLVPWVIKGKTTLPLIDGEDIGLAFRLAATNKLKEKYTILDIVGKETPTVKEVFNYLHDKYQYPLPHFSVPFGFAYQFAYLMRFIHKIIPGDPLIVPAIILLLEETNTNNKKAAALLNYKPNVHWKDSIDCQIAEMQINQTSNMKMNKV